MRYLLIGIGNAMNGDDGIGCYIANNLKDEAWVCIDCGTVPENFTGLIKRHEPQVLVIVDAADMGLEPGAFRQIGKDKLDTVVLGTHALPLSMLIDYLEGDVPNIMFVGIQPKTLTGFAEPSAELKASASALIAILRDERFDDIEWL